MIARRGKVWWLDIYVGGKRVRRSLHTREKSLAVERARDAAAELRGPNHIGTQLSDFIKQYLVWAYDTKPASYRNEYRQAAIIKAWFENDGLFTLESIASHDVERFRAAILERKRGNKDTSPAVTRTTANRYCAQLRTMFNKAKDWGLVRGDNPVSRVRFFRERANVRPLSEADILAVLAAVDAYALRKYATPLQREAPDLFRLILNTGLRKSEALGLRWADVVNDVVRVTGKGGKMRPIPLNKAAVAILYNRQRDGRFVFDIPNRDSPSLLKFLTASITKDTGIPFHLHLLRHAFASRLLTAGVDVVTISELLGHSAYMTTLLYAHSNPRQMRHAVDTLLVTTGRQGA